MKNIKDFLLESNNYDMPNLGNLDYNMTIEDVLSAIQNIFDENGDMDTSMYNKLTKLFNKIPSNMKFGECEEETAWEINDVIQFNKGQAKKVGNVNSREIDMDLAIYKINNIYVIQLVGDDFINTYVSK